LIPPMPPMMPPWPGDKPPWEAIREIEAKARAKEQEQVSRGEPSQPVQQNQRQPWMAGGPRPGAVPIIVHGLLPPQMTHNTFPLWVGPQMLPPGVQQQTPVVPPPQAAPRQAAPPQAAPGQAALPPGRPDGGTTAVVPQGPGQPPLQVERSAPEQTQAFRPVMPVQSVFSVGLPAGTRSRYF